jgi:methionyl-tRNA formyltransferase
VSKIKVCFLGTPEFAAQHLQVLIDHPHFEVVGVVTQPDRPAGRKMQLTPSAVKVLAEKNNLQILTPENLRKEPEAFKTIQSWQADVAVVVAFGQILSQDFLDSFKFGAVNVHGSLLPLYRGAAPIQRSLQNGDAVTGVSLQKMVFKLDAGPVIAERKIELNTEINATELYAALSVLGCELLKTDLIKYVKGELTPVVQDESKVTVAHKILKEESLLDFKLPAITLHNKIRAFSMGPGTYVMLQGKRLKIHKTKVLSSQNLLPVGSIAEVSAEVLNVQCANGILSLLEVQPESKPKLKIADFLKSMSFKKGDLFQ